MDTRHEVDQLVLELQKVKQEVSGRACACGQEERLLVAGLPGNCGLEAWECSIRSFQQRPVSVRPKAALPESHLS